MNHYSYFTVLAAHNRPNDIGLDFLFQNNNFVVASSIDAEHLIRRALFGQSQTLVSITAQSGMDADVFVKKYSQAGLTIGVENSYKLPQFGMPEKGFTCMQRYSIYLHSFYYSKCFLTLLFTCFPPKQIGFLVQIELFGECKAMDFVA